MPPPLHERRGRPGRLPATPDRRRHRGGFAAALLGMLLCSSPGLAQKEFVLDEDDVWIRSEEADPASPEGRLATIRRALATGQDKRAEHLATQWIERHPTHPLLPEAYLLRGDALRARRDYYLALYDYELVARQYVGSEAFVTALERELEIAKLFASGTKRRLWGMRIVNATDEAEELLIRVQERLPGSTLAEEAGIALGDYYFAERRMELAREMYQLFIENYPRSQHIRKARKRLIYAQLASFKGPEFDASGLYDARTRLQELEVVDPIGAQQVGAASIVNRIDESDANKLLVTAAWYAKVDDYIAAEMTIRRLVREYPRTVATRRALEAMTRITPRLPESVVLEMPNYAEMLRILDTPGGVDASAPMPTPEEPTDTGPDGTPASGGSVEVAVPTEPAVSEDGEMRESDGG